MAKRTIKINIKLPNGVLSTTALEAKVTAAATAVVDAEAGAYIEAQKLAKELSAKGIRISAEELMQRKTSGKLTGAKKKAAAKVTRKRIVLTDAKRKALVTELKNGAKTPALSAKYGVSTATVMNIKANAGLTKKRK